MTPWIIITELNHYLFLKDLGDLPPPSALSLQTVRVKVEKRASVEGVVCTGSTAAAGGASKPAGVSSSSACISPKSSPVGENRRDGRRDSRDSTVQWFSVSWVLVLRVERSLVNKNIICYTTFSV